MPKWLKNCKLSKNTMNITSSMLKDAQYDQKLYYYSFFYHFWKKSKVFFFFNSWKAHFYESVSFLHEMFGGTSFGIILCIVVVHMVIFIQKKSGYFLRISVYELSKSTTNIILNFLKNLKFICYSRCCAMCDVWCARLIFCKILTLWVKGRPKIHHLGSFRPFEWYSKIDPRWQSYIHFILQGLLRTF